VLVCLAGSANVLNDFLARLGALGAWASRHINIRYRVESHFEYKESDSEGCWLQAHDCREK
jgi:hypothetical protein